jgi:N-acyl-D-aspartate/D-glutamate deacylase
VFDLKIEGAEVIDGTGRSGSRTDVGIQDDRIVAIGDLSREPAGNNLHASGKVLAPGFIDMHSHSDWRLWENRRAESKVRQGVTTEVVGNCGFSPAPVSDEFLEDLRGFALHVPAGMDFRWRSVGEYLKAFDANGTALNVIQLVGHGTLRLSVMGFARREPTATELKRMQKLLADAIEDGAWGLSTGLIYAPGSYATTEELVTLAEVAARHRGFYASHIRGEGATLLDAVREAIHVGREADLPVQISHVKAAGRPNWGKVADALELIDAARDEGLDVMADVYPYTASSTTLRTLLPDWVLEGGIDAMLKRLADSTERARVRRELEAPETGQSLLDRIGWENVMVSSCVKRKDAEGKRISELAATRRKDAIDTALELIVDEGGKGYMILFQLHEDDLRRALAHPAVMIGSDGSALSVSGAGAAPKELRDLPAGPRQIRARAARADTAAGGPQDDRAPGAPPRSEGPRADRRGTEGRSRGVRRAARRRPGHVRESPPVSVGHRARARQRPARHQGRRAHREPPRAAADAGVTA